MASHTGSTMKWLTFKVLLTSHKGDSCYFLLTFLVFVFLQDCPRVEIPNLELSCIFSVIQFWYSNALQVQLNKHIKFHAYKWSNQHNWLNLFRMRSIIGAGWCQMTGLSTYDNFLDWTESLPHRFHFEHSTSICFQPGPRWQPHQRQNYIERCRVLQHGLGHSLQVCVPTKQGFVKLSRGIFSLNHKTSLMVGSPHLAPSLQKFAKNELLQGAWYTPLAILHALRLCPHITCSRYCLNACMIP